MKIFSNTCKRYISLTKFKLMIERSWRDIENSSVPSFIRIEVLTVGIVKVDTDL